MVTTNNARRTISHHDTHDGPAPVLLRAVLPAALAALLAAGCGLAQNTNGTALDPALIETIEPGKTTRDDVLQLLGPPDEVIYSNREHDPLFERAFRYRRERIRRSFFFLVLFGTYRHDAKDDQIMVFFDPNGVVEQIGARFDSAKASYGLPTS